MIRLGHEGRGGKGEELVGLCAVKKDFGLPCWQPPKCLTASPMSIDQNEWDDTIRGRDLQKGEGSKKIK